MNKEEFETTLGGFRAALEEADRLMLEAGVAYAVATDRLKEAKRVYGGHLSWGKAVGYVKAKDVMDDVVAAIADGPLSSEDVALVLNASRRAVAGALRRAVSKGLLIKREDGCYARA